MNVDAKKNLKVSKDITNSVFLQDLVKKTQKMCVSQIIEILRVEKLIVS